jgi:hypothetical protein
LLVGEASSSILRGFISTDAAKKMTRDANV